MYTFFYIILPQDITWNYPKIPILDAIRFMNHDCLLFNVSGEVEVHFTDGTKIGIAPNSSTVVFWQSLESNAEVFNTKEVLPSDVRYKLSLVPKAVEQLVLANRDASSTKYVAMR